MISFLKTPHLWPLFLCMLFHMNSFMLLPKGLHNTSFEIHLTLGTEKSRFAPFPIKNMLKILFGPSVPALPPTPNPFRLLRNYFFVSYFSAHHFMFRHNCLHIRVHACTEVLILWFYFLLGYPVCTILLVVYQIY